MSFKLKKTRNVDDALAALESTAPAFGYLELNPKHPSLNSQPHASLSREMNAKIWESYGENKRPGAYRIFWYYGPGKGELTVFSVVPHPDS